MKKIFDFLEIITSEHSISVEIGEDQEADYEIFASELASEIEDNGILYTRKDIVDKFRKEYGVENVIFNTDEYRRVEYEIP